MTEDWVEITDVTLRDGLQMEAQVIPTEQKVALFKKLAACQLGRLEVTSFVHPKWVPQLSDSGELCKRIAELADEKLPLMAFVPNMKGLERFLQSDLPWAAAFLSVSESFSKKNVNMTVDETLSVLQSLVSTAKAEKRSIRVYVSTVFGCPYEGKVSEQRVQMLLKKVAAMDPDEIALGDTIGVATPAQIDSLLPPLFEFFPKHRVALHLHNTYGMAMAAVTRAIHLGVRKFDGATGGIGGCPYAKGASGNLASEELAYFLARQGMGRAFPEEPFRQAITFLKNELRLEVRSKISEIHSRGGNLYGI